MKEITYGWYPSAKDVYRNAARYHNSPYELECMFRFQNSKYHSGQVTPPKPTISLGLKDPPGPDVRYTPAPPRGSQSAARQRGQVDLEQGSPFLVIKPAPRVKSSPIPTPKEVWDKPTKTEATPITVSPEKIHQPQGVKYPKFFWPPPRYDSTEELRQCLLTPEGPRTQPVPHRVNFRSPLVSREELKRRPNRIKSAPPTHIQPTARAPTPWAPRQRPVQSARPRRSMPRVQFPDSERPQTSPAVKTTSLTPVPKRETHSAEPGVTCTESAQSRPQNPTPNIADLSLEDPGDDSDSEDEADTSKDEYDEALEKYGWRAEIHGDPYGLKRTSKRLTYTVTCDEPVIPPEPPGGHMENWQTFFLNTIPSRPATYTIHKEWMSEVIHAKRMQLQKKQGVNFNFKKYAFAY
ncbi:proteoglycan 4-like [Liolophura sinensis]|uniref:proteoglycan 4-like n=1 Tax=Liolophura sinensis TaxID=3198878 RepID=UPI0031596683